MIQARDHAEILTTFAAEVWTPERPGFLDAVFSMAIRRSGLHSYKIPHAPTTPPEPDEFNTGVRCEISTITTRDDDTRVDVNIVVEGWRWESTSGDWDE